MHVIDRLSRTLADRYRIEGEIGAGGMATVYLAHDLKHDRRVALKVLRPELGAVLGTERFLSEIRVTANLQHPHLLPLFDSGEADGLLFYVMPYVEGESLRVRLERERQLPVDEAVRIAAAVASALHYAHRHGVVHRDLKPENILLHDGQPLIADFGIALAISNAGGMRVTQTGLSLGTPLYMSPEQATGDRVIDARSDVYSLATVLYEMLTGEPPHAATTAQAIIARLLTEKPRSMRTARPAVPAHVDGAVQRALEKLPADRFATAQEFSDVLTGRAVLPPTASGGDAPERTGTAATWRAVARHPITLAALALAAFGWAGMLARPRTAADSRTLADVTVRFMLEPISGRADGLDRLLALSPDGRSLLVEAAGIRGSGTLGETWLRRLDSYSAQRLPFRALHAAFSPDGRSLAYVSAGAISRVDLGAPRSPVRVGVAPATAGMAWIGNQLVIGSPMEALRVVPASGGQLRELMPLDSAGGELSQRFPIALPDGETVLYASLRGRSVAAARVGIVSLRTGERGYFDVVGAPLGLIDDLLVYAGEDGVFGVPVDLRRRRATGPALALVDSARWAALSLTGTLVVELGRQSEWLIHEVNAVGATESVLSPRGRFESPRYSPDGRRVLVTLLTDSVGEVWVHDRPTDTFSPVARRAHSARAEWSPDGRDILYLSGPSDLRELWRQPVDGTGDPELVLADGGHGLPAQGLFTPDGRHLVFRTDRRDIWYRAWSGDTVSRPIAADPSVDERNPHISPDGRWVAYASNETGTFQIYVRPFPGPGPRRAVTVGGGNTPVWTPDGRRIIYTNGDFLEEATLSLEPEFTVSRRRLFEHGAVMFPLHRHWDLSPDGSTFLLIREDLSDARERRIGVVHNWAAEVRRRIDASRPR